MKSFTYTVKNFHRNFSKHVTGVLFSHRFVKLRYNSRKFNYFLINFKKQFLYYQLLSVEYSDTCIWKF